MDPSLSFLMCWWGRAWGDCFDDGDCRGWRRYGGWVLRRGEGGGDFAKSCLIGIQRMFGSFRMYNRTTHLASRSRIDEASSTIQILWIVLGFINPP